MDPTLTPSQIISAFGGTAAIAQLCEVSPAAVSQWRQNGIPKPRMQFLRLAKPEVFRAEAGVSSTVVA